MFFSFSSVLVMHVQKNSKTFVRSTKQFPSVVINPDMFLNSKAEKNCYCLFFNAQNYFLHKYKNCLYQTHLLTPVVRNGGRKLSSSLPLWPVMNDFPGNVSFWIKQVYYSVPCLTFFCLEDEIKTNRPWFGNKELRITVLTLF